MTTDASSPGRGPIDVLVVCTGNICRSPMGEALLRAHLEQRGLDVHVHSAGTLAWGGAATGNAELAMRERGLDLSRHHSTALSRELVEGADLIIGMTRQHVWRVGRLSRDADHRAFLVGEIVRLGHVVGARGADEDVRAWAARVAAARPHGPIGRYGDEVDDPINEPLHVYRDTADRLDRDLGALAALLAPAPDPRPAP